METANSIAGVYKYTATGPFHAINPATGGFLEGSFHSADAAGVEVCAAMQHGGPFPATTDSRFTSVGHAAIYRFVRPQAWRNWVDELLPDELKAANPLRILRVTDLIPGRL